MLEGYIPTRRHSVPLARLTWVACWDQIIALEGQRHDFCVSEELSKRVAQRTAELLRPLLLDC